MIQRIPAVAATLCLVTALYGCQDAAPTAPSALAPAAPAFAAVVQSASGDFVVSSAVPLSVEPTDDECKIVLLATFVLDGTLEGSFTAPFDIEHAGPCDQPAPEEFEAKGTFDGTVAGVAGSFAVDFQGSITADGRASGQLEMDQGQGGLAGVEGSLTLAGIAGVSGSYSGTVAFDQD